MNRREFTRNTIMASALTMAAPAKAFDTPVERAMKSGIYWGSLGVGTTILEKFQAAKDAGFKGVEVVSHLNRDEVLAARAATGLEIPSVCGNMHWKYLLSDPDPAVRDK